MTYEANVKIETELRDLYEGIRAEMLESEKDFADDRFGELKHLIDGNSEFVAECVTELREHLTAIKDSI